MASAVAQAPTPNAPRTLSLEGIVTIAGAVILFITIVYFNNDLSLRLDTKIENVRTELKADIAEVRTELKADIAEVRTELKADIAEVRTELKADIDSLKAHIDNVQETLEADIQRLDDRYFSLLIPQLPEAADETGEPEASS